MPVIPGFPDRPARSYSLYRLSYPGPQRHFSHLVKCDVTLPYSGPSPTRVASIPNSHTLVLSFDIYRCLSEYDHVFFPSGFLTKLVYAFSISWSMNVTMWSLSNFTALCLGLELWTRFHVSLGRRESVATQNVS